jgi:hypothetical protein
VRKVVLLSAILAIAGLMPTRGFVAFARATQQPAPRFKSGVDVVEVAVLARDREGRPITDLQASGPGSEQVGFPIDTAKLSAGRYVLRVGLDGGGAERVERAVPFEIVGR